MPQIIASAAAWIIAKLTSKAIFTSAQIISSVSLISAHFILISFAIFAIIFVYNRINDLFTYISSLSDDNEILSLTIDILKSFGIFDAFSDVFAIFSPLFVAFLVYLASTLVYKSIKTTSDELFKVGVINQQ
jgi:hypothetical protein